MGIILSFGLLIGFLCGVVTSAVLLGIAIIITRTHSLHRKHAWPIYNLIFILMLLVVILAVRWYPFPQSRPGSDYDIMFKHLFIQGLSYASSLGLAAILTVLATIVLPQKKVSIATPP